MIHTCTQKISDVEFQVSFSYTSTKDGFDDFEIESIYIGNFEVSDVIDIAVYTKLSELCKNSIGEVEQDVEETAFIDNKSGHNA